jgi:GNAT superfamily N-acetyltransferase
MQERGDRDPAVFEPLALEIFDASATPAIGTRRLRDPGWFVRKLRRECVDLGRSLLVVEGDDANDPGAWLGYALVGVPRSLGGLARTAGIGLVPRARGRGLGGLLVRAVIRASREAGDRGLRVLAEPERVRFYRRHGLAIVDARCTWRATGVGHTSSVEAELKAGLELAGREAFVAGTPVASWFVEAWERTPSEERHVLLSPPDAGQPQRAELGQRGAVRNQRGAGPRHSDADRAPRRASRWRALVSRERGGWLVQRLESDAETLDDAVSVLHQLRGSLPASAPLFLYAGPPLAPALDVAPPERLLWRDALLASGFAPAQAWSVLETIHARTPEPSL